MRPRLRRHRRSRRAAAVALTAIGADIETGGGYTLRRGFGCRMFGVHLTRTLHVLAVVLWIGGVALVATVLLPALRTQAPADRVFFFENVERRFKQARFITALAGLYMLVRLDL